MTGRIEKTVFISYRRTNYWTALAVYQNLTTRGFDVFIDYQSIRSGDFEEVIFDNIKARAHFLVILSPSALERCGEPTDLMRREIELALDEERNIVPLMMEEFDFGSPRIIKILTGKLGLLNRKNGLRIFPDYFSEAMDRLCREYLKMEVKDVHLHPLSAEIKEITESQKDSANEAATVETIQLTAEEWHERGFVFHEAENFEEAIRCYTEAIRLKPDYALAFNNRANALADKGDLNDAIINYTEAIRLQRDVPEFFNNRGLAYVKKGDLNAAIEDFNVAVHLMPNSAAVYVNRGSARSENGDMDGAIQDFDKAIQLERDNADAFYNRGSARGGKGDLSGAIADYDEVIRLKPDYAKAYNNRGLARRDSGYLDGAIQDFTEVIRLGSELPKAFYNRALARSDKGDSDSAIADYEEAIRLMPDSYQAFANRGIELQTKGDLDGALKDFDEAIRLKPDAASIYYNRARLLEKKRSFSKAITNYQRFLDLGGGIRYGDQAEVEAIIKKLKDKPAKKQPAKRKQNNK